MSNIMIVFNFVHADMQLEFYAAFNLNMWLGKICSSFVPEYSIKAYGIMYPIIDIT